MKTAAVFLLLSLWQFVDITSSCTMYNWWSSFDKAGWSKCGSDTRYINGLWRNDNGGSNDGIYRIEEARCCPRPRPYWNQPTGCIVGDWVNALDHTYNWATCPGGYFLHGLYRGSGHNIHNIEYGKCCKPANHAHFHSSCYTQSVQASFDNKGLSKCNDGYFMAGVYRGSCDHLYCIEKFYCCKMNDNPQPLQSLADVKTRVMDVTMKDLALLAHYLGYGWCASCRAQYVGEDFVRNGDSWHADKKGPCNGYKSDHRLKMHYRDFSFGIKNIQYGNPVRQSLNPQNFYSGVLRNDDASPATVSLERSVETVRTVSHTTTSTWQASHELGIEINYTPPPTGGVGGSVSYKFGYQHGETTTDSESNTQKRTFKIATSKTLPAHTKTNWKIMVAKTRTTISYTATIIAKFSAELDGFMRWGGGYNGASTNYHNSHRGSGSRAQVNYKFGSASTPFYTELKRQSQQNQAPWQWHNMKQKYSYANSLINNLVNEGKYEFTLTGKFEDIIGNDASIEFYGSSSTQGDEPVVADDPQTADSGKPVKFTPQPGDPAPVNPAAPKVDIAVPNENNMPDVKVEDEVQEDSEEKFSKPYSFPTGPSENDTIPTEDDDLDDEMKHGDDKNDFGDVKYEVVTPEETNALNDELSELEDVVVEKNVDYLPPVYKDETSLLDEITVEDPSGDETDVDVDEETKDSNEQPDVSSNDKIPDSLKDQPGADSRNDSTDGLNDQLDEQTKKSVKAYIQKLLKDAMNSRK